MGELRRRGASEPEPDKPTGRFGNLGKLRPDSNTTPDDFVGRVKRLQVVVENIISLYETLTKDPTNVENMKAYSNALHEVLHMDTSDIMTILGAGIGAMSEIKKRGL